MIEEYIEIFTQIYIRFKSNVMHGARPVSREAPYPRLAIAYQKRPVLENSWINFRGAVDFL